MCLDVTLGENLLQVSPAHHREWSGTWALMWPPSSALVTAVRKAERLLKILTIDI